MTSSREIRIPAGALDLPPAPRARLARYLELPSTAAFDQVTEAEIAQLDAQRRELIAPAAVAAAADLEHACGRWISLTTGARIEATAAFVDRLRASGCISLVVAALTLGAHVDDRLDAHLRKDELFEAFVLKQWAATMTEQLRVQVAGMLQRWADELGFSLLPYDGPGYNGWPLEAGAPLLQVLHAVSGADTPRVVQVTRAGSLMPTNSMLIVWAVVPRRAVEIREESLAQCSRCDLLDCRFRMMPLSAYRCPSSGGHE